jgi:hypothetical protein
MDVPVGLARPRGSVAFGAIEKEILDSVLDVRHK